MHKLFINLVKSRNSERFTVSKVSKLVNQCSFHLKNTCLAAQFEVEWFFCYLPYTRLLTVMFGLKFQYVKLCLMI
jgi:hypothetical protein